MRMPLPQGLGICSRAGRISAASVWPGKPLAERLVSLVERLKARGVKISYGPNFRVLALMRELGPNSRPYGERCRF